MNGECGSRRFKKDPWAAESIVNHTFRRGVLFKQSRSQRRRNTSAQRLAQASLAPLHGTFMIVKRCVRERGIYALHSSGSCCPRRRLVKRERQRAADRTTGPPPSGTW
jgi:hypothetical protein